LSFFFFFCHEWLTGCGGGAAGKEGRRKRTILTTTTTFSKRINSLFSNRTSVKQKYLNFKAFQNYILASLFLAAKYFFSLIFHYYNEVVIEDSRITAH
jgi:hypothetical protein